MARVQKVANREDDRMSSLSISRVEPCHGLAREGRGEALFSTVPADLLSSASTSGDWGQAGEGYLRRTHRLGADARTGTRCPFRSLGSEARPSASHRLRIDGRRRRKSLAGATRGNFPHQPLSPQLVLQYLSFSIIDRPLLPTKRA